MALVDTTWYANAGDQSTTGYYAVPLRPQNTAVAAGVLRRQFTAPAVGSERVFVCIVAGTTANTTDATWVLTRGAKTTDGTVTWMECTGQASLNGDLTNTATWAQVKAATPAVLGQVIKRSNNASYQICTTAGAMSASEPTFSDTAGVTTTDTTAVWTSLGVVGNFTGGQAPHARLNNVCTSTWFAADNTVYVGDNHAESQATGITLSPAGTTATTGRILCHNHSGSYPPASTDLTSGASISTTGNVSFILSPFASLYVYGVAFRGGVGVAGTPGSFLTLTSSGQAGILFYFDRCSLEIAATITSAYLQICSTAANSANTIVFNNTTLKFAATGQFVVIGYGQLIWQNTGTVLASGSAVPSTLLQQFAAGLINNIVFEGIDLSQLTGALIGNSFGEVGSLLIKDCKLNASATVTTPLNTGKTTQLVRSDSGATAYKSARYAYEGTETTETSITRVGGAADPAGQAQSRKIITTANSQWLRPFKVTPYAVWNNTTGAPVTVTVRGLVGGSALPLTDDLWLEVEYLADASSVLGKIITTTKANVLATGVPLPPDISTWSAPAASPVTWDAATVTAVTLSGGNLVVTNTGTTSADQGARVASAYAQTSGKYYFEVTWTASLNPNTANMGIGVGTTGSSYTSMGNSATTGVVTYKSGTIYTNGSNVNPGAGSWLTGYVTCVAVDLDNRRFWVRVPTGNWNFNASYDPVTNVGGVAVPAGTMVPFVTFGGTGGVANNVLTANFGASSFSGAVPSGFTAGWPGGTATWTPFQLTTTLNSPPPGQRGYIHARVRAAKPSSTYYIDPQVALG